MEDQIPDQQPHEIVDISQWLTNDDYGTYPGGSKPKRSVICPEEAPYAFLIPGHAYLFKSALDFRAPQMWSEIIAYRLSGLVDVKVPPAFAAMDKGMPGVLIEFFYGFPDENPSRRLIHGTDLMQRLFGDQYDAKLGRPHSLNRIIAVCRAHRVTNATDWWMRTILLDALIGNTDRHAQNWGLLRSASGFEMAPAYDNGTSLGYSFSEEALAKGVTDAEIESFLRAGRHHIDIAGGFGKHGDSFLTLCQELCTTWPNLRTLVARLLPTPDAPIAEILEPLTRFDASVMFTPARADLVERLLRARRNDIAAALGL